MSSKAKTNNVNPNEVLIDNDPFSFLDGADSLPDDSDLWGGGYPLIQWNNNEKKWEFPLKHWAGSAVELNNEAVSVDHGESSETSVLLDTIHLSVIAWRVTWEWQGEDGKMMYAPQPVEGQQCSKRYNFMVLVKELENDEPAVITLRGYTGQYFQSGYEQARRRTLKMARQATGRNFPGYLFWCPMSHGEKVVVGSDPKKRSAIYPPAPTITEELSDISTQGVANILRTLYIGDHLKEVIAGYLFNDAEKWANENKALPAPSIAPQLSAGGGITVLPGGVLHFTDLSDRSPAEWIKAAMDLPGLFSHESHASNAFAKLLRTKGLGGDSRANQWEAWRTDLEKRWEALQTEKMLQAQN